MLLQKAFFRKKRVKIYIIIFIVLFSILFLLNSYKKYYEKMTDDFMNNHTILVVNIDKNNKDLIVDEKEFKQYQRVLLFEKGIDNDIILTPPHTQDGAVEKGEHSSKLYWDNLIYEKQIIVFPSSFLDKKLEDNQVIIYTGDFSDKSNYIQEFINKQIIFKFNNEEIELKIDEILDKISIPFICISDNLFNHLISEEENYTYYIELEKYSSLDTIKEKWKNLIKNKKINFDSISFFKDDELGIDQHYQNIVNMLSTVNTITIVIFYIILIFIIKDLISDEQKNVILLKNIGYNKFQNIINLLKNLIFLDLIIFLISIIIFIISAWLLNNAFDFNLEIFEYNFICISFLVNLLIELFFCIIHIKSY